MQFEEFAPHRRAAALLAAAATLWAAVATLPRASADALLHIDVLADGFAFQLACATGGGGPWVLQHSPDGKKWDDLMFMEAEGGAPPGVEVPSGILAEPDADHGFFRAVQLESDDLRRRRFLTERAKWRLFGIDDYNYEVRQNFGQVSWHGTVVVTDGEVESFVTIDQWPPGFEPDVPTIEDLFGRIVNAIANDAETINVTWDSTYGYPSFCFIDFDPMMVDEEQGWTIEAFTAP